MKDAERVNFNSLILACLDGSIKPKEFSLVNEQIKKNPEALSQYIDIVSLYFDLSEMANDTTLSSVFDDFGALPMNTLKSLGQYESQAPTVEVEEPESEPEVPYIGLKQIDRPARKTPIFSLITAAASVAILCFIMVYVYTHPHVPNIVANLTESINAKWRDSYKPFEEGADLSTGTRILEEGFVKITFYKGTEMLVQGPAEFNLEAADQVYLVTGRVVCKVPTSSVGFIIRYTGAPA